MSKRRRAAISASPAADLDLQEAALLAALVRSPSIRRAGGVGSARDDAPEHRAALMQRQGAFRRRSCGSRTRRRCRSGSRGEIRRRVREPAAPGSISRKRSGASCSAQFGSDACCEAGCACTRPTIQRCSAPPNRPSRRASRRSRRAAGRAANLQGSLVAMSPETGEVLRDRRRPGFRREQLQPRDAGATAGRIRVQADRLCRSARARLRAGNSAARSRCAD